MSCLILLLVCCSIRAQDVNAPYNPIQYNRYDVNNPNNPSNPSSTSNPNKDPNSPYTPEPQYGQVNPPEQYDPYGTNTPPGQNDLYGNRDNYGQPQDNLYGNRQPSWRNPYRTDFDSHPSIIHEAYVSENRVESFCNCVFHFSGRISSSRPKWSVQDTCFGCRCPFCRRNSRLQCALQFSETAWKCPRTISPSRRVFRKRC